MHGSSGWIRLFGNSWPMTTSWQSGPRVIASTRGTSPPGCIGASNRSRRCTGSSSPSTPPCRGPTGRVPKRRLAYWVFTDEENERIPNFTPRQRFRRQTGVRPGHPATAGAQRRVRVLPPPAAGWLPGAYVAPGDGSETDSPACRSLSRRHLESRVRGRAILCMPLISNDMESCRPHFSFDSLPFQDPDS